MSAAPTPASDIQTAGPDHWARSLYEQQVAVLGQFAETGLAIALSIGRQVKAAEEAAGDVPERAIIDFARVSRSVRLTLMLQARLIKELIAFDNKVALDTAWDHGQRTRDRKAQAEGIMERIIGRAHDDPETIESLIWETSERLDREDLYGPLLSHPVSELVAMICKDLGLDPDWSRLAREAWAKAEIESGITGWPLALKSSPVGGGGPRSGGGGLPDAAAPGAGGGGGARGGGGPPRGGGPPAGCCGAWVHPPPSRRVSAPRHLPRWGRI
jgi:hypothetical protein